MRAFVILAAYLGFVAAESDFVTRKLCKDVDVTQCSVQSVVVDPCPQGPAFCTMKRDKTYGVTLDMTPHFSAESLRLSVTSDVDGSGDFSTVIKSPGDACRLLSCPLEAEQRRIFDVDLMMDKRASGKFPVKIKLWNEENSSQACCVTFNVKVK
ncbi:MD-2-related lipid-recognition protein [Helicoverpa armigera]|uniref:MD-2-related lipid-recognition protein n=1 Tax=Helicoverpa armigera TaxID=29058 RepID=UPI0030834041